MDLTQSSDIWCVDDTLFYPLGLINHTTGNKSVFVTWNDKYLMNFIFKKSPQGTNRCNKFIVTIPNENEIVDILILEVNTLVLLKNGVVCYFASIKSIHPIPWLSSGVRCVSESSEGFSLIRVCEDRRIILEVYRDELNIGKSQQEATKSFDLTFDETNLFDSDWNDVQFTLTSVVIDDINRKFIGILIGEMGPEIMELYIFSINNNLFALYTKDEGDYEIKTLPPQISSVEQVKYLKDSDMLLIFLSCGIIEVWYMSRIALVIEKHSYINGSELVHHTFANNYLYFTDEQRVCRLKFTYDLVQHSCQVSEQRIDAPGMIAITYEEDSGELVCLSNNNIFYRLSFDSEDQDMDGKKPKDNHLFELNVDKVRQLRSKSNLLHEMITLPARIDNQIEEEYRKQELIAISRKSAIYSDLISANVSFYTHIPETKEKLIYPGEDGIPPFSYFAVVSLKILTHEIFKTTLWSLMIAYATHVRLLLITADLLGEKFNVLIPIRRDGDEMLPEFDIHTIAYVNLEQEFVCVNIPVKINDVDVKKLFSHNRGLVSSSAIMKSRDSSFTFRVIGSKIDVNHVCQAFGVPNFEKSIDLEADTLIETLYFLGEKVMIFFNESKKEISVECCDPIAIYYAKLCVFKHLWENVEESMDEGEDLRRTLLELQCQVEKRYGSQVENHLHLANLKRVYEKLRTEIVVRF